MPKKNFHYRAFGINTTVQKVLRRYGHNVADEMAYVSEKKIGRKERRRKAKLDARNKKREYFKRTAKKQQIRKVEPLKAVDDGIITKPKYSTKPEKIKSVSKIKKTTFEIENEKDDRVIQSLEKKLYLNKRKARNKLPKSFMDAGLDYILDVVDGKGGSEVESNKDSDDEIFKDNETVEMEEDDENFVKEVNQDNESTSSDRNESDAEEKSIDMISVVNDKKANEKPLEPCTGKYVPPALRVKLSSEQEERVRKLSRRLKGLLNRLSDANLSGICNEIENLYHENSRAIMHKVLTNSIMEQFDTPDPVPESLVSENAMLIAILRHRVGIECLMHFYEFVGLKLYNLITKKDPSMGKAANNLLQVLGCLYQIKCVDCKVIQDVFRFLIESFEEKDVELMLEILTKVGFQLRKDDPEFLKVAIKDITEKCEELKISVDDGSRMSYMLSILMAVKNNNVRKVTGFDPDTVSAKRQKLASLIRTSKSDGDISSVSPVTLQDFLDIETKGRWWIVGSSFAGRPMLREQSRPHDDEFESVNERSVSGKVAEAARLQRMNTDVRRKIFYSIMTADDFIDAFEKVMKCGLKGKQLREIATVIVDCCQQEKNFNPYYVHLLNRFCQQDRQFAISIQCTLWDRFKMIDSMKSNQVENIAKLLSQLIILDGLSLSCLKAIEFTQIDKAMINFLRLFLCTLAESSPDLDKLRNIFDKLRTSKAKLVRQGLNLFLQFFVIKDEKFMAQHSHLQNHLKVMSASVGKVNSTFL